MEKERKEEPLTLEGEIWKPVVGYDGVYEVSNFGRVKNVGLTCVRYKSETILKQHTIKGGYLGLYLSKNGKRKFFLVHRLVYEAFIGKLPKFEHKGKGHGNETWEVNHKDENKTNNNVENLELVTKTQNINYGTGILRHSINITKVVYQYTKEKVLVKIWYGGAKECQKFGFDRGTIGGCCRGELKQHRGYLWSYVPL